MSDEPGVVSERERVVRAVALGLVLGTLLALAGRAVAGRD
jgi:hypothetical protein